MTDRPRDEEPLLETDDRFPSGPWKGYYLQRPFSGQFRMRLSLTFQNGRMTGDGLDGIGPFLIRGRYETEEGKCSWTKQYIGRHAVSYQGYNEGKGIWATWVLPGDWSGGFHIWPEGMADPTVRRESRSEDLPASIHFEDEAPATLEPSILSLD